MKEPLVSVIIPTYNSTEFLEETIQSVLSQEYQSIEILIIDDHSTDGSFEFASNFARDNIKVFKNVGRGACVARNHGFNLSKGKYVQFLDSDDLLSPDKIGKQINGLQKYPNYVSTCNTISFFNLPSDGSVINEGYSYTTDQRKEFLINLYGGNGEPNMIPTVAWLAPRDVIIRAGLWNEQLHKDQDGEFFCRVVLSSEGIYHAEGQYSYYRRHLTGNNIAAQKQQHHLKSELQALKSKRTELSKYTNSDKFHRAMALQYKIIAINAWPEFKELSEIAMKESRAHGRIDYLPKLGGKLIEFLKEHLGWKCAKSFSIFIHRFY